MHSVSEVKCHWNNLRFALLVLGWQGLATRFQEAAPEPAAARVSRSSTASQGWPAGFCT